MMKIQCSVASVKASLQYNIAIPSHVRKITRVIDRKKLSFIQPLKIEYVNKIELICLHFMFYCVHSDTTSLGCRPGIKPHTDTLHFEGVWTIAALTCYVHFAEMCILQIRWGLRVVPFKMQFSARNLIPYTLTALHL